MKDEKPLVSVIIPTYNRPALLKRGLESVLEQTFSDFEVLVINDGGADADVSSVIKVLNSEKIRYFSLSENKGRSFARNTGIKNSRGKYLAYLDDDDLFYPEHLEILVDFLEANPDFKVACSISNMTILEKVEGNYTEKETTPFLIEKFDYDSLLVIGYIPFLSVMHHKTCLEQSGLFDETLNCNEDWDYWLRIAEKFEFAFINKVTSQFFIKTDRDLEDFYETRKVIYERYKSKNNYYRVEAERAKKLAEQNIDPDYNFRQGCRQIQIGKYSEGINLLVLYLQSEPDNKAEVFLLIAEGLKELGDEKTATIYYHQAQKLN